MGNKLETWLSAAVDWAITQWLAWEFQRRDQEWRERVRDASEHQVEIEVFRSRLEEMWIQ